MRRTWSEQLPLLVRVHITYTALHCTAPVMEYAVALWFDVHMNTVEGMPLHEQKWWLYDVAMLFDNT